MIMFSFFANTNQMIENKVVSTGEKENIRWQQSWFLKFIILISTEETLSLNIAF